MGDAHHCSGPSVSEMTHTVSSGTSYLCRKTENVKSTRSTGRPNSATKAGAADRASSCNYPHPPSHRGKHFSTRIVNWIANILSFSYPEQRQRQSGLELGQKQCRDSGGTSVDAARISSSHRRRGVGQGVVSIPHRGGFGEGTVPHPTFFQFWTYKVAGFCAFWPLFLKVSEADICSKVLPGLIIVGLPSS